MQTAIKNYMQKHTPPIVSILMSIAVSTAYIGDLIDTGFGSMKEDLIMEARAPFYLSIEYSLAKQNEKLEKDPGDIKSADIELLAMLCQDDFGVKYVPDLPPNRKMDAVQTCEKLTALYKSRLH